MSKKTPVKTTSPAPPKPSVGHPSPGQSLKEGSKVHLINPATKGRLGASMSRWERCGDELVLAGQAGPREQRDCEEANGRYGWDS